MGALDPLACPDGVLAWRRTHHDDTRTIAINFRGEPVRVELGDDLEIEVASDGAGEGARFDGSLAPDRALLLR